MLKRHLKVTLLTYYDIVGYATFPCLHLTLTY